MEVAVSAIPETSWPLRASAASVRTDENGAIVARLSPGAEIALNPTAFALWELCDGETSIAEMVDAVCQLFEVDADQASRDVEEAIKQMRAVGLIQ